MTLSKTILAGILSVATAFGTSHVSAQDFPSKPINFIHGLSIGGQTDISVRVLAESLARVFNTPVVVQAKPGAAQQIAASFLSKAPPDGYTIGHFYQGAFSTVPLLQSGAVQREELLPILGWQVSPQLLIVRSDSPYRTLADLVVAAKSTPDIPYGHLGKGSVTFMAPAVFSKVAGIQLNDIQFKGDADLMTAVLGGHIAMASITEVAAAPFLESGKVRALVTFAKQRTTSFPDIATFEDQGFQVPIQVPVGIIFAPKGTPAPIAKKLSDAVQQALQEPKTRAEFARLKLPLYYMDANAVTELIDNERKVYQPILKEAGLLK